MANIFSDLNKFVNTIDKVDKLLTEKPKRTRTLYITKRFTEEELEYLLDQLYRTEDFEMSKSERTMHNKLINKLK
jgi:predicted Mrr-cat superfamily restriction endonuclease